MFRAVLESWVRMWGWVCGRIVLPIVVARSSAVFTLDVPVSMNCGTYVTRARRGLWVCVARMRLFQMVRRSNQ